MLQYVLLAVAMLRHAPLPALWTGFEDHWISRLGQTIASVFA